MWFRTRYSLSGVHRARGDQVQLDIDGIAVTIWYGQHPRSESKQGLFVTAICEVEPPAEVAAFLMDHADKIDTDDEPDLPDPVEEFAAQVTRRTSAAIRRAVEMVRWRMGLTGPRRPYSTFGSEWSLDHSTWQPLPSQIHVEGSQTKGLRLTPETERDVQALAATSAQEPVGHQLLREARDVFRDNERSALVIAVAAVESGFKALAGDLVPDADWLLQKLPSPPLVKMLKEYLPSLPTRLTFDGKVHGPPKYVRTLLAKAVDERNGVAHLGVWTMKRDAVKETLNAAGDTLYLLDYYAGHAWARDRISENYLTSLGT